MPLRHHGGTPHTKSQQRRKTEQEITLEQAAGQTQHDVDAEPFDNGRWERTVDDHLAGYPPAPTTGGTMSVQDEAERLRALASSRDIPIEILHQAEASLDNLQAQVREILGGASQHLSNLEAAVAEVKAGLQQAIGAAKGFEEMLHKAADGHARG